LDVYLSFVQFNELSFNRLFACDNMRVKD